MGSPECIVLHYGNVGNCISPENHPGNSGLDSGHSLSLPLDDPRHYPVDRYHNVIIAYTVICLIIILSHQYLYYDQYSHTVTKNFWFAYHEKLIRGEGLLAT